MQDMAVNRPTFCVSLLTFCSGQAYSGPQNRRGLQVEYCAYTLHNRVELRPLIDNLEMTQLKKIQIARLMGIL